MIYEELRQRPALRDGLEIFCTFTRSQPAGWTGYARRIDGQMLSEVVEPFGTETLVYVSGPTLMVESVANLLVQINIPAARIRTARFGPTGGAQ